ncbi:MAG: hypothetical protein M1524_00805 [Patescibacteria group bacterium]|nr:hypothetical protein [Patescibacteria group bacterium]
MRRIDFREIDQQYPEFNDSAYHHARRYIKFLGQPDARRHFVDAPRNIGELINYIRRRDVHLLAAINMNGETVGGEIIELIGNLDFIMKTVIDQDLQVQDIEKEPPTRLGEQMIYSGIDWAFSHPAFNGSPRKELYIAYIQGIKGCQKMRKLVRRLGFDTLGELDMKARVPNARSLGFQERLIVTGVLTAAEWERILRERTFRDIRKDRNFFRPDLGLPKAA